ncbi:MAG: hypothetical protein QOD92_4306 [Acidimicrobiaceae bacterium]
MTAIIEGSGSDTPSSRPNTTTRRPRPLVIAGAASVSAGAIHAAAIGAHAEHPQAAKVFAAVALLQVAWGVAALAWPGRRLALAGVAINGALVVGWVVAKKSGLSFIDGLDVAEPIQFADALCAALAFYAALEAGAFALQPRFVPGRPLLANFSAALLVAAALPGMVEAGNHVHSDSHKSVVVVDGKATLTDAAAAVPTKPFNPLKPIDLGGVAGVTEEQQARAENLVAVTLVRLPQWADPAVAEANGFHTIGDALTGDEHLINWSYISDDKTLDPDRPEALVYNTRTGKRVLEAAMFMLPPGSTLDTVPDIGGPLTQWHIHDNLCFTNDPVSPHVAGLTDGSGGCRAPLVKLEPVPMIHVWITPNECGPFSALEGVGAGQIKPGEKRLCDQAHGTGL